MQFTDAAAQRICLDMCLRMRSTDREWRERNLAFPASATTWSQRYQFEQKALTAIEEVYTLITDSSQAGICRPEGAIAADVRAWLQTYLAPAGWGRYLGAARQRKSKKFAHTKQTTLDSWTSHRIGKLAEELQLQKKALLDHLMEFLACRSGPGVEAKQQFCDFVLAIQRRGDGCAKRPG
jgi:hypothetical protein